MNTDRRNLFVCALLVLASIAATVPVLEMGLHDDWSYAYTARDLAATGHLHYFGWASAMIGVQAWFAAFVIRILGFSFTTVRLTTAVFAVGSALLLYKLYRAAGLNTSFACLGTLAVVISPLFIPLAVSFMTDVPALFFLLVSFYCGLQALRAPDGKVSVYWLTIAAVSGLLGGTVRQVIWGVPLSIVLLVAWIRRDNRAVAAAGSLLFAASAVAVAVCLSWLSRQPAFEWDQAPQGIRGFATLFHDPLRFAALIRTCLLLMLPVLILFFFGWRRTGRVRGVVPGVLAFVVLWAIGQFGFHGEGFPFGNLVTANGILREGTEAIGSKPVILSRPLLNVLSFITLAASTACVVALFQRPGNRGPAPQPHQSIRHVALLGVPFYVGYFLILFYRTGFGDVFDRYLLIVLPAANLPLLYFYQQRIRDTVPVAGWLVVGLFAAYGVATSHDYISSARARLAAASSVMASGVPRTRITAGLEFDGWTEIETGGHVNSFLLSSWSGPTKSRPFRDRPGGVLFRFWALTPSIDPEYFVVYSRQPGLVDAAYPPVTYSAWLPLSTRSVFVQVLPGSQNQRTESSGLDRARSSDRPRAASDHP